MKSVKSNLFVVSGASGSGKTTLLNFLNELGEKTLILDEYIHQTYKKGQKGYEIIKDNFGSEYVKDDEVDRVKLRNLVFNEKKQLNKLNKIIYKIVSKKLKELEGNWYIEMATFVDLEKMYKKYFKKIILVVANNDLISENLKRKFGNVENFKNRLQISTINHEKYNKVKYDILVENTNNLSVLKSIAQELIKSNKK